MMHRRLDRHENNQWTRGLNPNRERIDDGSTRGLDHPPARRRAMGSTPGRARSATGRIGPSLSPGRDHGA